MSQSIIIKTFESLGSYLVFFAQTIKWTFRKPFDYKNIILQMLEIGYKSFPVVAITIFFTGMVMALQIGKQMDTLLPGSSVYIGSGVTISMFRELAPVLTGVLLSGRVGSSIAAQIGTMKVTEQIDALVTLSTNPIQYLSVPRFLASFVMIPSLTILADIMGVLGGAIIAFFALGITPEKYFDNIISFTKVSDFTSGLFKSVFFGIEISIIACYEGFNTVGGAEGVGRSTISAVVKSSMTILISDYFLTYLMQIL